MKEELNLTSSWDKVFEKDENVDLYDNFEYIPFDKIEEFLKGTFE